MSIFSKQELGTTQGFSVNRTSPVPPSASSNDFPMRELDATSILALPRHDQPIPAEPRTMSRAYSRTRQGSVISTNSPPSTTSLYSSTNEDRGQKFGITRPVRAWLAHLDPRSWHRPSLPFVRRDSSADRLTSLQPWDFTRKIEPVLSPRCPNDPHLSGWNSNDDLRLNTQSHHPDPSRKYGLGITMPTAFWANANNGVTRSITKPTNLDGIMNTGDLNISAPKLSPGTLHRIENKYTSIRPAGIAGATASKSLTPVANASTSQALSNLHPHHAASQTHTSPPEPSNATPQPLVVQRQEKGKNKVQDAAPIKNITPPPHNTPNTSNTNTNTSAQGTDTSTTSAIPNTTKPTIKTKLPTRSPLHSAFSPLQPRVYVPGAGKHSTDRRPAIDEGTTVDESSGTGHDGASSSFGGGGGWIRVELGSPRAPTPIPEAEEAWEGAFATDGLRPVLKDLEVVAGEQVVGERLNRFRRFTRSGQGSVEGGPGLGQDEGARSSARGSGGARVDMQVAQGVKRGREGRVVTEIEERKKRESEMSVFTRHPGDRIG